MVTNAIRTSDSVRNYVGVQRCIDASVGGPMHWGLARTGTESQSIKFTLHWSKSLFIYNFRLFYLCCKFNCVCLKKYCLLLPLSINLCPFFHQQVCFLPSSLCNLVASNILLTRVSLQVFIVCPIPCPTTQIYGRAKGKYV